MKFEAKLNLKFYIVTALLFGLVILLCYGVYFLNANEILMEDDLPMDSGTKTLFTVLMSAVALSWSVSLLALIRQIVLGFAFYIDEEGIHYTATAIIVLAFILVVPINTIPFDAVKNVLDEDGILTLEVDKSKTDVHPLLRPFARKNYHFFLGFTSRKNEEIKTELNKYLK